MNAIVTIQLSMFAAIQLFTILTVVSAVPFVACKLVESVVLEFILRVQISDFKAR